MSGRASAVDPVDGYEDNVFVNCPFDDRYADLLKPLLFTVVYLGYRPRIASERSDAGEHRLSKICQLISESRYSIHDLSRLKARTAGDLARMNMPFELGIDYGSRRFGPSHMQAKRYLVLGNSTRDFKAALSDLAGVDIKSHESKPDEVVRAVRDWFYETLGIHDADSPTVIWYRFNDFTTALFEQRLAEGIAERDVERDIQKMPVPEYINSASAWVTENLDDRSA